LEKIGFVSAEDQRRSWNCTSDLYQKRHQIGVAAVQYGPLVPNESDLELLGNVAGLNILEVGCGGGQNCIVLARQGATVIGVDVSDAQIDFARRLAQAEDVVCQFHRGDVADLTFLPDASQDLLLAVYVFPYVADLQAALAECARVLRPAGRLILSQDHPIRACYWHAERQEESLLPARSYFDTRPLHWAFATTGASMTSYHRTLGQWFSLLRESGLEIEQIQEFPLPPGYADEPWADEYTAEVAIHLPQALLLAAKRHP
jgi:SAM-dependent methyltransferase